MIFKEIFILIVIPFFYGSLALPVFNQLATDKECIQEPRDIFLVIDGSSSLRASGFAKVRSFIVNLIKAVDVREEMTHFGMMQFSARRKTKIEFSLDDSHDSKVIRDKVRAVKYHNDNGNYVGYAMKMVEKQIFTKRGDDRPDVKDYLIIFTDEFPDDEKEALQVAERLKKNGVTILVIGVNWKNRKMKVFLEKLASAPKDMFLTEMKKLNEIIEDVVADVTNEECPIPTRPSTNLACSQEPHDIFLVIDGSASIGNSAFNKIKRFLAKLIRYVDVTPEMTHFGMLQFSTKERTSVVFELDYSHKESVLLRRVRNLVYQAGAATYAGHAIKIVDETVFTPKGDDRPQVGDVLIVFTDGKMHDTKTALRHADNLKKRGVRILGIAAGPKRNEFKHELVAIASDANDVMTVEFDDLDNIITNVFNKVCKPIPTTIPTTVVTSTAKPTTIATTTSMPTTTLAPTTTTPPPSTTPAPPMCASSNKHDMLIIIDDARFIKARKFYKMKKFVMNIISEMPIDNGQFMIGILPLSDYASPPMFVDFSERISKAALLRKLQKLRANARVSRYNPEIFDTAMYQFHKMNYQFDREDVPDTILFITTRMATTTTQTKLMFDHLKFLKINVISIAVGRERRRVHAQNNELIGYRKQQFLSSFGQLGRNFHSITQKICTAITNVHGGRPPRPERCRQTPHDVFFVIDGSASIEDNNFKKVRKFLLDLITLMNLGISDMHVGFLQFSEKNKTEVLLDLGRHNTHDQMKLLDTMKYQAGRRTMTGDALMRVKQNVFNGKNGDRAKIKDVLIIFTDGNAHDKQVAIKACEEMKSKHVHIITIGAGNPSEIRRFSSELEAMSTDPKNDTLLVDFDDLKTLANRVFPLICKET